MQSYSDTDFLIADLKKLARILRNSRAHTYSSENADHYRGFDAGQLRAAEELEEVLRRHLGVK